MSVELKYKIAEDGGSITCLTCGMVSHNKIDVSMKYCGHCHEWLGESVCDFCSGEYPCVKDYEAQARISGELLDGREIVDGDMLWSACAECNVLIESGDWEGLMRRAMAGNRAKWGADFMDEKAERAMVILFYHSVFGERFTVTE